MKLFLSLVVLVVLGSAVLASPPPDHPGKCFLEEYNVAISPGETFSRAGKCISYSCRDDLQIAMLPCGFINVDPKRKCKLVWEDNTKAYPDCCPRADCD